MMSDNVAKELENSLLTLKSNNCFSNVYKNNIEWVKDDTGYTLASRTNKVSGFLKDVMWLVSSATFTVFFGYGTVVLPQFFAFLCGIFGLASFLLTIGMILDITDPYKIDFKAKKHNLLHIDSDNPHLEKVYNKHTTNYINQLVNNKTVNDEDKKTFYKIFNGFNTTDHVEFDSSMIEKGYTKPVKEIG